MTRREKFIEDFGINPSMVPMHPEICGDLDCDDKCPFGPNCGNWWNEEYHKPEKEIEYCPEHLQKYIE